MNSETPFIEIKGTVKQRPDGQWCASLNIASRCSEDSETIDAGPFATRSQALRAAVHALPSLEKMMDEEGGHISGYRITIEGKDYGR